MKKIKLITSADLIKWQGDRSDEKAATDLGLTRSHYNALKKGRKDISIQFSIRFMALAR